jgi:hypothetical protein
MNFIRIKYFAIVLLVFLTALIQLPATDKIAIPKDSIFAFSIEAIGAYSKSWGVSNSKTVQTDLAPSLRLMWKPNRALNIGLETAYIHLKSETKTGISTEFGKTDFAGDLYGVPLLLVFDMELAGLDLYGGVGAINVLSTLKAFNTESSVSAIYGCYMLALAYKYNIFSNFGIGLEAKAYTYTKINTVSGMLCLNIFYDFYRY